MTVDFNRLAVWRDLPVLTEAEVEALVSLSPSTLKRLRTAKVLEVVLVPGCNRVLYKTASVLALLGEDVAPAPPAKPRARVSRQTKLDADLLMSRRTG